MVVSVHNFEEAGYIKRRLNQRFFNQIPIEGLQVGQKTIILVVPQATDFIVPDVGGECIALVLSMESFGPACNGLCRAL